MHRNFVYLVCAGFNWKTRSNWLRNPRQKQKEKSRISHEVFLQFGSDALEFPLSIKHDAFLKEI